MREKNINQIKIMSSYAYFKGGQIHGLIKDVSQIDSMSFLKHIWFGVLHKVLQMLDTLNWQYIWARKLASLFNS